MTVAFLLRRLDSLEQECNQNRALAIPQQSNSSSNTQTTTNSQAGNSAEVQARGRAKPMETEDNIPGKVEFQERHNHENDL